MNISLFGFYLNTHRTVANKGAVTSENDTVAKLLKSCRDINQNVQKLQCWDDLMNNTIEKYGLNTAFAVFKALYSTEPQFSQGCHGFAHLLGAKAYELYSAREDFYLPPETSFCGYGFYHGFTEKLLGVKSNPRVAGELCDSKKGQMTPILYAACYHGIGHGILALSVADTKIWGQAKAITNKALELCGEAADDPTLTVECSSGVFMELAGYLVSGQYGLTLNKNDPLAICRLQDDKFKNDCYTQMNGVLSSISGGSFSIGAKYLEAIPEDYYAEEATTTYVAGIASLNADKQIENITSCRSFPSRLHLPCIKGLALAFMLRGNPGNEYKNALNLCQMKILNDDEREQCFKMTLSQSKGTYQKDKFQTVCDSVEANYKKYCNII